MSEIIATNLVDAARLHWLKYELPGATIVSVQRVYRASCDQSFKGTPNWSHWLMVQHAFIIYRLSLLIFIYWPSVSENVAESVHGYS